jgi:hypothetical protein
MYAHNTHMHPANNWQERCYCKQRALTRALLRVVGHSREGDGGLVAGNDSYNTELCLLGQPGLDRHPGELRKPRRLDVDCPPHIVVWKPCREKARAQEPGSLYGQFTPAIVVAAVCEGTPCAFS